MNTAQPFVLGTVHHASFRVDDLEVSLRFYCGVLGCTRLPGPDVPVPVAWLQAGDSQVHLFQFPPSPSTGYPPDGGALRGIGNHVAFQVADLDAAVDALRAHGHAVNRANATAAFVQDPSGNLIELMPRPPS